MMEGENTNQNSESQTVEKQPTPAIGTDPNSVLAALEGTGFDVDTVVEQIKKEGGDDTTGKKEEETAASEKVDKEKKEPGEKEVAEVKFEGEIKEGAEIKAEDGDYTTEDGSIVTIKDNKVEKVVLKEEPSKKTAEQKIDNPFVAAEKEEEQVEVKDFDQAASFITAKTGVEIKDIGDIPKLVSAYTSLKEDVDNVTSEKNQLLDYKAAFDGMPDDLLSIVLSWLNEKDYHEQIQSIARMSIDFSKPVSAHTDKELINVYFPGKFSDEDYQEANDDPGLTKAIGVALDAAKANYKKDQQNIQDARQKHKDSQEETRKSFERSRDASLDSLKKDVPFLQEQHKQKIKGILDGGIYSIMELFADKDGMLKKDAAKLIALAIYGEDAIKSQSKKSANKAETQAREEILKRTSTKDEKKSDVKGKAPSGSDEKAAKEEITRIIPQTGVSQNPFAKPYYGEEDKR